MPLKFKPKHNGWHGPTNRLTNGNNFAGKVLAPLRTNPGTDRIRIPIPITLAEPNFEANRKKAAGKSSSYLFERFTFFIRSAHFSYLWQMILFLLRASCKCEGAASLPTVLAAPFALAPRDGGALC